MRRAMRLVVAAALAWLGSAWPAEAQRVALVIGNASYQAAGRLSNPLADARGVGQALGRLGFRVDLVLDAGKPRMEEALRRFGRAADGAEIALLFYAGHGIQLGGENWLVPTDARLADARDAEFEMIGLSSMLRQMERARTRVVILDACRNNPLAARMRGLRGTRSVGQGLAPVEAQDVGTLIAFSTSPGAEAEDGTGVNSPFTAALLRHIERPGIDLQIMLRQVRNEVRQATGGQQTPWENSSLLQEVVLRPGAPAPAAASRPPEPAPAAAPPAIAAAPQAAPDRSSATPAPATTPSAAAGNFLTGLFGQRAAPAVPPAPARPEPAAAAPPRPGVPARGGIPFRCPPAGLRVTYDRIEALVSLGADPADPGICLRERPGSPSRWLLNFYFLPVHDEAVLRRGLGGLWPAEPGRAADFAYIAQVVATTFQFRDVFRVLRADRLTVGGQAREVLVIERRQEGRFDNNFLGVERFWWDIETGAWLKRESEIIRGRGSAVDYTAVSISQR